MTRPVPTQLDIDNAARRQAISDKFRREYDAALALAEAVLGPGWAPTGRHYLVDKDDEDQARRTNTKLTPAANVISCRNATGEKRHFRVETMAECPSVEAGFGDMLMEPHPTMRLTWAGNEIVPHRYSLCWSWYEPGYRPQTAEQLAAARERRQERAVEKEAAASPLFADQIKSEGYVPKRKGPGR